MSQTVFGAQAVVTMLNRAFNNTSPANAVFNNQVATAGSTEASQTAFALQFGTSFAGLTDAELSARVLGNLGVLPNAELEAAVTQYFADNGLANRGLVVLQLGQILSTLETAPAPQNIFNDAAKAWNTEVEKSFIYSSSTSSTTPYVGDFAPTPVGQGQTFTLTTGVDNVAGTGGNDTITGVVDTAANGGTLTPGDVVDGGAGTDTANFIITTAGKWAAGATIKNVEVLNFRNVTGGADAIDVSNVAGATQLWNSGSTAGGALTLNNIQANATLGVANTVENLTATFKDGTVGLGGSVSLAFNAAGTKSAAGVITRTTVTAGHAATANAAADVTLNLTAVGANYAAFADGGNSIGGIKTVKVDGSGSLDITAAGLLNNVTTVDASANGGGLTIDLTGNNKDVTFTGGAGNDTLTLANFNGKDVINGGGGANNTLNVALTDVLAFTKAANVTNIQTLGLDVGILAANQTVNGDFFGISNVTLRGAGLDLNGKVLSLSNLANGTNVTFAAATANAGTVTVDVKGAIAGTNESATLTFGKNLDLTTKAVTINAAGLETITLATSAISAGGVKLAALNDANLTTLKITGSDGINLAALGAAPVTTVDASGVVKDVLGNVGGVTVSLANSTKSVTFTGGQGVDTYTASGKGDVINGSLGADVVTLGAGADKLVYAAANQSNAAATDVIGGFNVTADSIQFAASLQSGTAAYIGAAAFTNSGATQLRMNGANLEVDLNGDATADMVITLTGLTAADFGAANFVFA